MSTSLEAIVAMLAAKVAALERDAATQSLPRAAPFALGRTTLAVNDTGPVQTVQARLNALSVRDGIPVLYGFGFTGSPPIGTDVHVAFLNGNPSKSLVIAGSHQTFRLRGLSVGDSALYDIRGAYLWLTSAGPAINGAGLPTTVNGDLHVTGAVIAGYGGADQVGVQTHKHAQGNDSHGDIQIPTNAPTAGT
jgi:phage gp45-like